MIRVCGRTCREQDAQAPGNRAALTSGPHGPGIPVRKGRGGCQREDIDLLRVALCYDFADICNPVQALPPEALLDEDFSGSDDEGLVRIPGTGRLRRAQVGFKDMPDAGVFTSVAVFVVESPAHPDKFQVSCMQRWWLLGSLGSPLREATVQVEDNGVNPYPFARTYDTLGEAKAAIATYINAEDGLDALMYPDTRYGIGLSDDNLEWHVFYWLRNALAAKADYEAGVV